MKETLLLTGGTGLLGSYFIKNLLVDNSKKIEKLIALTRGKTQTDAEKRILQTLHGILPSERVKKISRSIKVVRGDITKNKLGLPNHIYNDLTLCVNSIYHSAALCEFKTSFPIMKKVNIDGTKNLLKFALACQQKGRFKCAHHISTVAIAGNKKGIFYEKER